LVGVDGFIDIAESRVGRVLAVEAAGSWDSALVDFVAFDVARSVVAGKESCSVVIGVAGEGAADLSGSIVSHLSKVADVMTVGGREAIYERLSKLSPNFSEKTYIFHPQHLLIVD
jgi:hypothetical protein